jgi:hypothetical protein
MSVLDEACGIRLACEVAEKITGTAANSLDRKQRRAGLSGESRQPRFAIVLLELAANTPSHVQRSALTLVGREILPSLHA